MSKPYLNFNKNNSIFKQLNIKKIILDFIYKNINFNKIIQLNINTNSNIYELINNSKFIIEPYINGLPCLCVIMKDHNNFYSCLVDKKNLKNDSGQIVLNDIDIFNFNIKFSNIKIYNGTILDGVYKYNDNKEEFFIVNDIYKLNGENLINDSIVNKFINFNSYIKYFSMDNFNIYINNFIAPYDYELNNISNNALISELNKPLDNSKTKININNIINGFKFMSYKTNKIYNIIINNSNQFIKLKSNDDKFIYNKQQVKEEKILVFLCKNCKDLYLRVPDSQHISEGKSIPYFICSIHNNKILTANKKDFQYIDCNITNDGIIPIQSSSADKPNFLSDLIEILDIDN